MPGTTAFASAAAAVAACAGLTRWEINKISPTLSLHCWQWQPSRPSFRERIVWAHWLKSWRTALAIEDGRERKIYIHTHNSAGEREMDGWSRERVRPIVCAAPRSSSPEVSKLNPHSYFEHIVVQQCARWCCADLSSATASQAFVSWSLSKGLENHPIMLKWPFYPHPSVKILQNLACVDV